MSSLLIEGYTPEELLNAADETLAPFIFTDDPIVFNAGSAEILGKFSIQNNRLVIQLAQIDGGGEGVLPSIWILANQYAAKHNFSEIEWIIHAVNCAKPNLKLRRLLIKRGFVIETLEDIGEVYHLIQAI